MPNPLRVIVDTLRLLAMAIYLMVMPKRRAKPNPIEETDHDPAQP